MIKEWLINYSILIHYLLIRPVHGDRRCRRERIRRYRHKMGRSMGLSFPVDPRDEATIVAVDDNDIHGDVDGCLRNRAWSALQDRVCLLRVALLVYLSVGKDLLEQSYLSLWRRGYFVLGNGSEQIFVSQISI